MNKMSRYIYFWAVLSVFTTMTNGAPSLEQKHGIVNTSQRYQRHIFSNADNNIGQQINGSRKTPPPAPKQSLINNQLAAATMVPFTAPTPASPQFLKCFGGCLTTSEYNPVCASNRQQYHNRQKFDCARRCGADIQIVRKGSCRGLL